MELQQSILLCLIFSCMAGLSSNCSKFVVLFQHKRQQEGKAMFKHGRRIALFSGMMFQLLNNVFMVFASWFGPVSIYWPTNVSTQLLTNTIFVGVILRTEPIGKNMQVAVVVMSISVIYLPIIGPGIQEDQDLYDLTLGNPFAMAWLGLLALIHYGCALVMYTQDLKDKHPFGQTVLLGVGVTSAVLGGSVSKAASLVEGLPRTLLMCMFASISGNGLCEALLQSTTVPSMAIYVPLFTFFSLMLNAVNGIIVWEDWKVVNSWIGYSLTLMLTFVGVYLMTDLDFFQKQSDELREIKQEIVDDARPYLPSMPSFMNISGNWGRAHRDASNLPNVHVIGPSRHQDVIRQHTRGLKRGNSEPDITTKSVCRKISLHSNEDYESNNQEIVSICSQSYFSSGMSVSDDKSCVSGMSVEEEYLRRRRERQSRVRKRNSVEIDDDKLPTHEIILSPKQSEDSGEFYRPLKGGSGDDDDVVVDGYEPVRRISSLQDMEISLPIQISSDDGADANNEEDGGNVDRQSNAVDASRRSSLTSTTEITEGKDSDESSPSSRGAGPTFIPQGDVNDAMEAGLPLTASLLRNDVNEQQNRASEAGGIGNLSTKEEEFVIEFASDEEEEDSEFEEYVEGQDGEFAIEKSNKKKEDDKDDDDDDKDLESEIWV